MTANVSAPSLSPTESLPPRRRFGFTRALRRFARNRMSVLGAIFFSLMLVGSFGAPVVAPYAYDEADFTQIWKPASADHLLGTDKVGRDIFSRLLYGTRTSLIISFSAQAIVLVVGITVGALAGMAGTLVDSIIMRLVDIVAAFPTLLFAILVMALLGSGIPNLVLALSVSSWVLTCQLTRAQILSLREREYVIASRSFGARTGWIIWRHLLRNIIPPLIVNSTLAIPSYIMAEAGLGFLGMGIMPPLPSLGQLVQDASLYLVSNPTYVLMIAAMLGLLILSIAFIGDGLREALDPRALA